MLELSIILGTYVITAALLYSDGPWGLFYKFRNLEWVKNFGLLECFLCLSGWIGAILCIALDGNINLFLIAWAVAYLTDRVITIYELK